jgi:hypothetical protein
MRVAKWKAIIVGRDGGRVVPVEGRHYNTVGYPQLVERGREPAGSTVFNWVRGLNSGKESTQTAHQEGRRNTAEEWFREAIRKFRRRWQPRVCLGDIFWASSGLVSSLKLIKLLQRR